MGLDVGEVRIGISVSDETGLIARPLTTMHRVSWRKDLEALDTLVRENRVEHIVVGHPVNMNGSLGFQAERIQGFVKRLQPATSAQISLWDERLSSVTAEQILIVSGVRREKRKQVIDRVAAVIILQDFLDHRNGRPRTLARDDHGPE